MAANKVPGRGELYVGSVDGGHHDRILYRRAVVRERLREAEVVR